MKARKFRLRIVASVLVLLAWGDSWVYLRSVYHETKGQRFTVAHYAGRVSMFWDDLYTPRNWDRPGTEYRADLLSEMAFFNPKYPFRHRHTFRFPDLPWPVSHVLPPFDWHNYSSVSPMWQMKTTGAEIPYWFFLLAIWIKPILQRLRKRLQLQPDDSTEFISVNSVPSVVP